ncbi:MAG TPA: SDR family NAD(P)-dependent oxidoreductase [Candidatus Dormibacteraeota bacterium]|nr:SDR family NAD(P)-dependent oxidoreductase [Candidatus Dormibacteraeota bacterium]
MPPSNQPLAGQVALVTGSSRGIGFAIARKVGRLGAAVSLCARHSGPLEAARRTLVEEGISAVATQTDLTQKEQVERLVEETRRQLGDIDIAVNNAGIGWFGPLHEASEADWDRVIDTNLKAPFLLLRSVVPHMIRRRSGHVIQIASLAGKNAFAGGGIYCASKWGLLGMSYAAAEDLRGYGIRTSVICPGSVLTEFSSPAGKDPNKMLQPDDVAHVVEMILLQQTQSFISEISIRPAQKP